MQYIIMDMEWNNAFAKKRRAFMNEMIEIGAVKLDETLTEIDSFSMLVRTQIGKRLRSWVKDLTSITADELEDGGKTYQEVYAAFAAWVGEEDHILLTWGDGDIRVLIDNNLYYNAEASIPFVQRYADLQTVVQRCLPPNGGNQIGLSAAAVQLGIAPEEYTTHRALGDCRLGAECLRRVYAPGAPGAPEELARVCDADFYRRLSFKAYVLSNIKNPRVDKDELYYRCKFCGAADTERKSEWKYNNQYFRAEYYCPHCGKTVRAGVRFKMLFDRLDIRRVAAELPQPEEKEKDE